MIERGAKTALALAVSLHAPTDDLRNHLVPLNKKYPWPAHAGMQRLPGLCPTGFHHL